MVKQVGLAEGVVSKAEEGKTSPCKAEEKGRRGHIRRRRREEKSR